MKIFKDIIKILIVTIANVLTIIAMTFVIGDFELGSWYNSILITIGITIGNIILWPILTKVLMKFIILSFGIGALLINSLIFYIVSLFIPGVSMEISGFLGVPIAMAIATTIAYRIIDFDYFNRHIKVMENRLSKRIKTTDKKGIIILEIDGLSIEVLKEAIEKGLMPTVKNWIENTHVLRKWETDLSSQTGASQAGILHGNNRDIVAYRWVEKENNNRIMVSGKLDDAEIIEQRISNGKGLLSHKGISITNMFTGDSSTPILTSSRFKLFKNMYVKSLDVVFIEAYSFQRIFILFVLEIIIEIKSQIEHKVKNIKPRLRRNIIYTTIRAGANVFLREIATETLIGNIMKENFNSTYVSYVGYDEIAHHCGVRDRDVWNVLKQIDLQFDRIKRAEKMVSRNYEFVVLSDHGQSNGATFKQRYDITLANYVRSLLPEDMKAYYKTEFISNHFKDAYIPQNKQIGSIVEKVENMEDFISNLNKNKFPEFIKNNDIIGRYSNNLDYITKHESTPQTSKKASDSELIVLGSGNLGLIYLTQWNRRLNYEEIVMRFPNLIPGLVKHPGIGFILVESFTNGPMVIGDRGIYYLNTDHIIGTDPLKNYGKNAVTHLKRHNTFKHMPDILVNSYYDPKSNEVCAFEELIGSHGGLGGEQSEAFILYPNTWESPDELVGAKSIYDFLKKKISEIDDT